VRLAQIRLALDRAAVAGDGGVGLSEQAQGVAKAVVKDARVGAERDGSAQMLDTFLDSASLTSHRAQQVPGVGMFRIALKNEAIGRLGVLQTTGPVMNQTGVELLGDRRHERPRHETAAVGLVANPYPPFRIKGMVDDEARNFKESHDAAGGTRGRFS
jgi:hypothetical protein